MQRVYSVSLLLLCCLCTAGCGGGKVANIERVLQEDSETNNGATSIGQVVSRMKAIDMSGCPNDFKAAYLAHIHAWEAGVELEKEAITLKADSESAGAFVESFVRGFLGDPLGKYNEVSAAHSQLQRKARSVDDQVKQTYHRVEELAVAHGASLTKKKQSRKR